MLGLVLTTRCQTSSLQSTKSCTFTATLPDVTQRDFCFFFNSIGFRGPRGIYPASFEAKDFFARKKGAIQKRMKAALLLSATIPELQLTTEWRRRNLT